MEEETPLLGQNEDRNLFKQFLIQGGTPAFVVRENNVRLAWERIVRQCCQQRDEWLAMVKIRLGTLVALAGDDMSNLAPWLDEDQRNQLQQLHTELKPKLRVPIAPATAPQALHLALGMLAESCRRFNQRWLKFLQGIDLTAANEMREKYNRYYLIEKECVIGSPILAHRGFTPLKPLTIEDLEAAFSPLPVLDPGG